MRLKNYMAMAAAVAIGLAACTREEINNPAEEKTGVTVTAGIEQRAETRITYEKDGDWTKVLWEKTENFSLVGKGLGTTGLKFIKQGEDERVSSATFKYDGDKLANEPYQEIFYGVYATGQGFNPDLESVLFTFFSQNGSGTDKQIMIAEVDNSLNTLGSWNDVKFTFKAKTALMKLTLKNDAFKGKTVSDIKLSATGLINQAYYYIYEDKWKDISYGDITIAGTFNGNPTTGEVTIYVAQPTSTTATGEITVTATCDNVDYGCTVKSGTFAEAAVYMAAEEMIDIDQIMTFTINVPTGGSTFVLPLDKTLAAGVNTTINWGDGSDKTVINGTGVAPGSKSHLYAAAGRYRITITSSAASTGQQMPKLLFQNSASKTWIVSMDTPLLNMGTDKLDNIFYGCSSLKSIAAGLFDKNLGTDFTSCFQDCINLESVPELLFKSQTGALSFSGCFAGCIGLVLNANIFCNESAGEGDTRFLDKGVNFMSCFHDVGSDDSVINGGTAPALWNYTFDPQTPTKNNCFTGCRKVANVSKIYASWGGPKTGF